MQFLLKTRLILLVFFTITILVFLLSGQLAAKKIDVFVLHLGNSFFMLLSMMSAWMSFQSLKNKNPNVFIRAVIGGMFLKMILTALILLVYYFLSGTSFDTKAVFISLFFYLFYLATEVVTVMKMNKATHA